MTGAICALVTLAAIVILIATALGNGHRARESATHHARALASHFCAHYLVQPCMRCHEFRVRVLDVSPNGRSIEYACAHCGRKSHAPASTEDALVVPEAWSAYAALVREHGRRSPGLVPNIEFDATPAPLPFERTTRSPIPESVRGEVWRRDVGKCTTCGTPENLEFDHIIPVARGGATTARNLQLLCQRCNAVKGARI